MRVVDLTDKRPVELRVQALDHAVAIYGPLPTGCPMELHQAAIIETARLFYAFLAEDDERSGPAMAGQA